MNKKKTKTTQTATNKKVFTAENNIDELVICVNKTNCFCLVNDCVNKKNNKIQLTSVWSLCLVTLCLLTSSITSVFDSVVASTAVV